MGESDGKKSATVAMGKIGFSMQVITAVGIVATLFLGWVSWKEARLAREDQSRYFLAEKAPRITILNASWAEGLLFVEVKNEGESIASDIAIAKGITRPDGSVIDDWEFAPIQLDELNKGETVRLHVTDADTVKGILSYLPVNFELHRFAKPNMKTTTAVLHIALHYQNVFEERRVVYADFYLKP